MKIKFNKPKKRKLVKRTILHLVLKEKYFKRIYEGTKKQEYRDCSAHWNRRLQGQHHTHIKFQLAYSKNPPTMIVEVLDRNVIERKGEFVYCFELGDISDVYDYPPPTK
jgi:hypothetical protein